jgi:hypothetical protein
VVRSSKNGSKKNRKKGKGKARAKNLQPDKEQGSPNPQSGVAWNSLYQICQGSEEAMPPDDDVMCSEPPADMPMQDFVSINHNDMALLIAQGYLPQVPINGPNEGMPEYVVPRSEWSKINRVPIRGHSSPPS